MRWLHFSIEKMVKKTTFWKSYINNGLVMYFEYRENTIVRGITIWSILNSLLLLFCTFVSCIHCSFLHTFIFWFSSFNLLFCYLLLKVLILFIQSPSDSNCFFFFTLWFVLLHLQLTGWSVCNCGCRRFLHIHWNPDQS